METIFQYQQIIEAQEGRETNLRNKIVSYLRTNSYIIIQNVPNILKVSTSLSQNIEKLSEQYSFKEMQYSNLGMEKQNNTFIYANNSYPLQNEEFFKKMLNLNDDESPEILKKIDVNDQKELIQSEEEFSKISRQVFANILTLIDLHRSENKEINEIEAQVNKQSQVELTESFEKSEVQKYKCILQSGQDGDKVQRFSSPDLGLGSIIACGPSIQDKELSFIVISDNNQDIITINESDIIITCGELLSNITNGYIKKLNYLLELRSKQGTKSSIHQQIFYPSFTFDTNNQDRNNKQQTQNQQNHKQIMKKPNVIATQFVGMCAMKMKMQYSSWMKNHNHQLIGHQAQEYVQTLFQEELYPQIKVVERQFNNQDYPIRCFNYNFIDSTMNVAKMWKKIYVTENMSYAFLADQQFKGQGQNKNTWISPKGNCYVTFLVKYEPMLCYCLSQLTAISVVETLDLFIPNDKQDKKPVLKWINDVFVNEKKISGVLCRVEDEYISIGIGVNLNHNPIEIPGSTCLKQELQLENDIDIFDFVQKLWNCLAKNLQDVQSWNSFNAIIHKVEGRMLYLNQKVKIYDLTLTNVLHEGIFRGLNDYGNAMLESLNDSQQIDAIFEGRMRPQ